MKRILCDAQLLTTHTLSAKGPTLNCHLSVCFGRASFADRIEICRKYKQYVIMKLFLWLLQRVAEMVRNLVLIVSWPTLSRSWLGIFRMVRVVSYKIFAMVVACKKEDRRETIVDNQRDMDIDKVVDAVVKTEYMCGELSTRIRSVSLLKFREGTVFTRWEASEGLCAKDEDLKLMYSMVDNSYLEGTGCSTNDLKGVRSRYCIFVSSGGCKRMTGRRKVRYREPSRICPRLKIAMQTMKNRKIRCSFKRRILGCVPRSSILYKFTKSSIRKEHICFKYFVGISARKEKKKKKTGCIVSSKSVGKESLKIVVKYLGIKTIKVCSKALNSIMTLKVIRDQYT